MELECATKINVSDKLIEYQLKTPRPLTESDVYIRPQIRRST